MNNKHREFTPDWVVSPWENVLEAAQNRGWTQEELSIRMGYEPQQITALVKEGAAIDNDVALRLAKTLGSTASFWLNLESNYQKHKTRLGERQQRDEHIHWLEKFPVKALMNCEALTKRRQTEKNKPYILEELLRFFGVASPQAWEMHYGRMQVAFRKSSGVEHIGAVSAWLRLGERLAESHPNLKYDQERFEKALWQIRHMTTEPPHVFEPKMRNLLLDAGVLLLFVPSIPGAKVSGAARWLSPERPAIQLSLFGRTNDKFWFNFFHEAAHILLHAGGDSVFLDNDKTDSANDIQEGEANCWARNFLIPEEYADELRTLVSKESIRKFSEKTGIHPAIVVGRLQHEKIIEMSWCNDLKVNFILETTAQETP